MQTGWATASGICKGWAIASEPWPQESQESAIQPLDVREEGHGEGAGPDTASLLPPQREGPTAGQPHIQDAHATSWLGAQASLLRPGMSPGHNIGGGVWPWLEADGTPGGKWSQGLVSWHGLPGTHFQWTRLFISTLYRDCYEELHWEWIWLAGTKIILLTGHFIVF